MDDRAETQETSRSFRFLNVIISVILSIQAWFGDFVNIFLAPSMGFHPEKI